MIKNIKFQFMFLLGCLVFMNGCKTDEGNYDYVEINEAVFNGLVEDYTAIRFENLTIATDQVDFTIDTNGSGNYEYRWEAVSENVLDDNIYQLSTDKSIDAQIDLLPGNYTLYYTIKDLGTDVEFQYTSNLEVINSIFEGWMVLNDVAGEPRLDMVSLIEDGYKEIHDVLSFAKSPLKLTGTPGFVNCYSYEPNFYGIYVSTSGNGTTKLDPDTFDWRPTNNLSYEFVSDQPENFEAEALHVKGNEFAIVVADSDYYKYFRPFSVRFSVPVNVKGAAEPFDVSKHVGVGFFFSNTALYDETNKMFVYNNLFSTTSLDVPSTDPMFDAGKDLLYMVSNKYNGNGTTTFAVLKDPVDGKNHIGMFNVANFSQLHYSEIMATDFDQAENIAIDPTYAYIFYNVGSKVYEYDIFTATTVEMLDKGSQEITNIQYRDFSKTFRNEPYQKMSKQLIVCSYDSAAPEGSNGTMELYNVPEIQGQIELDASYSGFGKIVNVAYRER